LLATPAVLARSERQNVISSDDLLPRALTRGLRGRIDALQFTRVLCKKSDFEGCDTRNLDRDALEVMECVLSLWPCHAA
jgi:hypothetical protein